MPRSCLFGDLVIPALPSDPRIENREQWVVSFIRYYEENRQKMSEILMPRQF